MREHGGSHKEMHSKNFTLLPASHCFNAQVKRIGWVTLLPLAHCESVYLQTG
jgi:hypothetical protein